MFTVEETYDLAALTVLCRAARKRVRRVWRAVRAMIWVIFALGAAICLYELASHVFEPEEVMFPLALAIMLAILVFEDRLNAWIALRQLVPGTAHSVTVFADDAYTVTTDATETRYKYENITALCETERYFILFLGKKHGQIFDKQGLRQGGPDAFRVWLEKKTGKTFQTV